MILMESLLDKTIQDLYGDSYLEKQYQLVFELGGTFYTGKFLRETLNRSTNKKYIEQFNNLSTGKAEKIYDLFKFSEEKDDNGKKISMNQKLRENFREFSGIETDLVEKSLLKARHLFLENLISFISSLNPDEYLNDQLDFRSVIYNLRTIDETCYLEFYLMKDQKITPVSIRDLINYEKENYAFNFDLIN